MTNEMQVVDAGARDLAYISQGRGARMSHGTAWLGVESQETPSKILLKKSDSFLICFHALPWRIKRRRP